MEAGGKDGCGHCLEGGGGKHPGGVLPAGKACMGDFRIVVVLVQGKDDVFGRPVIFKDRKIAGEDRKIAGEIGRAAGETREITGEETETGGDFLRGKPRLRVHGRTDETQGQRLAAAHIIPQDLVKHIFLKLLLKL